MSGMLAVCMSLALSPVSAQAGWTWMILETRVVSGNPDTFDLTLGVRANTQDDEGLVGNLNIRGTMSPGLYDFQEEYPPVLLVNHLEGSEMTLTNGPCSLDWQVNAVFGVGQENGTPVALEGATVATIRFFIEDTTACSQIGFDSLQQTYAFDLVSRVQVAYDTTGGNVPLKTSVSTVDAGEAVPAAFGLSQNFPNPFNPETAVAYRLPKASRVLIEVYDVRGVRVKVLKDVLEQAGEHRVLWDGLDEMGEKAASGVYLMVMRAGSFSAFRKMTLLR